MLKRGDIVIFLQDKILNDGSIYYSSFELVFKVEIGNFLIFADNHIITKDEFIKLTENKIVEIVKVK